MQKITGLVLLTTSEAADYLRIKERKLYELVADGAVPCTKVTGKWLFPRADLDRWLLAGMEKIGVVCLLRPSRVRSAIALDIASGSGSSWSTIAIRSSSSTSLRRSRIFCLVRA